MAGKKAIDNSVKYGTWCGACLSIVIILAGWVGFIWGMEWLTVEYPWLEWAILAFIVIGAGIWMVVMGLILFAAIVAKLLS